VNAQRCILCEIVRGELVSRKVCEDEHTVGVLDIKPRFAKGQCVVFPKRHIAHINDLQDEEALYLFKAIRKVSNKIEKLYKPEHITLFMRGRTFSHIHVILAPTFSVTDDIFSQFVRSLELYAPLVKISEAELDEIAEKLRQQ